MKIRLEFRVSLVALSQHDVCKQSFSSSLRAFGLRCFVEGVERTSVYLLGLVLPDDFMVEIHFHLECCSHFSC
jgi:hypothetical protein